MVADINRLLADLFKTAEELRDAIQPYDTLLQAAGFKRVQEQGIRERIKAANLITGLDKLQNELSSEK